MKKKQTDMGVLILGIILFILGVELGHGQSASVQNGQAQPLQMQEHPLHADQHALGTERSLLSNGTISYAQGERPMSEFLGEPKQEVSLGDVARYYRDHKYIPKKEN